MESNSQVMKAVFVASRPTSSMMMMTRENVAYDKGLTEMSLWDAICVCFIRPKRVSGCTIAIIKK